MKNSAKVLSAILVVLMFTIDIVHGQKSDSLMYKAYLLRSETLWESAVSQYGDEPSLQKAIAYYGLLSNTMASSDEEAFDKYEDTALEYLEDMEEKNVNKAEAAALRSSIYGFIMGYSPWQGIYYGPKSSSAMEKAFKTGEDSPIVNMISGTSLFYTPTTFGGDKAAAAKAFEKAANLFLENEYQGWMYLNTLAHLGQAQAALGQKAKAIETYQMALAIEPKFEWVSDTLLPKAKKLQ